MSIYDESSQVYSSAVSSVIDLDNNNNQDLVDQLINSNSIDFEHFNGFDLPPESVEDNLNSLLGNKSTENAKTEQLLDSIEQMLKSMDDPMQVKQTNVTNKSSNQIAKSTQNHHKLIKIEPGEGPTVVDATFKKILPKLSPKPPGLLINTVQPVVNTVQILQTSNMNSPIILPVVIENFNHVNSAFDNSPIAKRIRRESSKAALPNSLDSGQLTLNKISLEENNTSNSIGTPHMADLDSNLAKKQSRMIKNRESACLSRKRKKEYVQTLEESLVEEKKINELLKTENLRMKEKILALETEV